MKLYIPFSLSPMYVFTPKKGENQEIFYDMNLNLQISFGVFKGRGILLRRNRLKKKDNFCTAVDFGQGRAVLLKFGKDSQSKRREYHTQLHGRGIHKADIFLQRVFHPHGNSQEGRTAKEGQVTHVAEGTFVHDTHIFPIC